MILTTKRHGRTKRDVRNLVAHLNKQAGQQSRVVRIGNVPLSDADDVMAYMTSMRDASRATVAMHHVSISPRVHLTAEQIDEAVQRILAAMGAEDHAYVLWQHSEKARTDATIADQHYHLVVGHIGPDGRALDDSWSYIRMEAAARTLEADFGEELTPSRMTKSVAKELRRIDREDVADTLVTPPSPPTSSMSSKTRAKADRQGLDLPSAQADVRAAWAASDGPSAFRAALAQSGYEVHPGKRSTVFVITKSGIDVGALDRIVREKRAAVAARMEEKENVRTAEETAQSSGGDLLRGARRQRILPDVATLVATARRSKRRAESDRRTQGNFDSRDRDIGSSKPSPRAHRNHVRENLDAARLRGANFRQLEAMAKAVANGRPDRSLHRRVEERAAIASFRSLDFSDVTPIVMKMAAGRILDHSDMNLLGEVRRMKSLKPAKSLDLKTRLLAQIAPRGFDASAFSNDIHMVKVPSLGRSTARVMTRDGGWLEFDVKTRKPIRTWGPTGRAQVLAQALANVLDVEVQHLAKTVSVGAHAEALHVVKLSEDKVKSLSMWWSARGYVAVAASDGCWVDAGHSRIKDNGDHLEIHGGVTDEAIAATLLKARDAWNGSVCLDGHWTQAEQDRVWIAAQRQGIEVVKCTPSPQIQAAWRREQEATAKGTKTISAVRTEMVDAQDLIAAAKGDRNAIIRLPGSLQAFAAIYLDDEQRKHLAAQSTADVIPHLNRFRQIGTAELEAWEKRTGRKFTPPRPDDEKRTEENRLDMR
ncbi:relaxase/mobilization nuclease domain-containing protein [Afipia birgiae]|uniref:relaxase/mobilization nuclease domain-containing protein n=1 Tax=Afipia birgiae TaxID=151414 RepID=UPI0002E25CDD|nr:relaxase/mobilization nuclease domain-containing protein [Afipia birgiae]